MREGVGMLLAELMRIKAEGDYDAIKTLVDTYGVHFDPKLRDQVVARYKALNLPTYWAGVNAKLTATLDGAGERPRPSRSAIRATPSGSISTTARCTTPASAAEEVDDAVPPSRTSTRGSTCSSGSTRPPSCSSTPTASPLCRCARRS